MRHAVLLFLPLVIAGFVGSSPKRQVSVPSANPPAASDPVADALGLGLERYPLVDLRSDLGEFLIPGEKRLVGEAMDDVGELIRSRARKNTIGRGDHGKGLGCYPAEFTVASPDVVRADDRAGIARREDLGRTFAAVVRLSNSEPRTVPDYRSATTGLAVKVKLDASRPRDDFLFDRTGEQDFVAGGLDAFVSRSIVEYGDLFRLRLHPFSNVLAIRSRHPEAFSVFGTEPLSRVFRVGSRAVPVVLEQRFSSLVPYAWGDTAVKYRFEPCHSFDRGAARFTRFDGGYQAKLVAEFLNANDVCWVMRIQARPRARSGDARAGIETVFPIEDATVPWPESGGATTTPGAEFREVARLRIKSGSKAMDDRACEHLAFNPWNGLKAHQPLGSLNRARLAVYKRSELVRKELYRAVERP